MSIWSYRTYMSIQREKTKHQSLFKTVNKAGSSNGGGGHAGDSNDGEMVCGTHFPFSFLGLCDAAGSRSRPTYFGIDGSLWFVVHWFLGFCHPGVFVQFQNLWSWISTCGGPPSVLDWLPSPFPVSGCQGIPIRNLPSLLLFSRIRSSKNPQILRFLHWSSSGCNVIFALNQGGNFPVRSSYVRLSFRLSSTRRFFNISLISLNSSVKLCST